MSRVENSSWWCRHWKWFVPTVLVLLVMLGIGFVGLIFYGVSRVTKSSDVYQMALQKAKSNTEVSTAIGKPITEGWLTSGNISTNDASGSAELSIPISGPKGDARIYLSATKSVGKWTFNDLLVEIDVSDKRINLLQAQESH